MKITKYTETLHFLRQEGYREATEVLQSGDFAVHGDTLTLWGAGMLTPMRLHFLGEDLERSETKVGEGWKALEESPELVSNALSTTHGFIYPGEYIVHPYHGVGIFRGILREKDFEGIEKTYLSLEYAGNDRLLVPFERNEELMPYIGTRHPRLTRLYSKAWQATKERVQRDLIKVARALLKIYAARQVNIRSPHPIEHEWAADLNASAGFELTTDQQKALKEIQTDLSEYEQPMDRLLCGDVGFGKTEVALRAAAQVMAAGKQVAFIAPTTVLVEQHATLLKQRFAGLPIQVAHMSRLTKSTDKGTLEGIQRGTVDIVVGTHRVLGSDIQWKDLGLLIVDEEQKFGVAHKERLKSLRPVLDVLSLSATPIPRTLSMSLSGLRGLSILRHAPHGRLPIKTVVSPYQQAMLQEALRQELEREGQVYVVHNRVGPLAYVANEVRRILLKLGFDQATVEVAHGQLPEKTLAGRMADFMEKKIDVLVASTIVEHGLDSQFANTLVVLNSDHFGLSDLYQLRGRVGRRSTQAFAYFFTGDLRSDEYTYTDTEPEPITQTARERLHALLEADTLGSGWSIALRDLEIRGGGNILGHEQHGSMESIGLLLYAQLLQEEIGRQAHQQGIKLFQKAIV